ncbi:uncharacterized protein LOC134782045 [Penaeus indicus]|uniref:uncharacterized protein LOC134782045 n=1 Tax=Penaeus indicus TaxID=29960 RepID=UPI00300D0B98
MLHECLIFQHPRDIPELMPDGICPKQLVAPGLFKSSDKIRGVELLHFTYLEGNELCAIKVTGNGYTPAQTASFVAQLDFFTTNIQEPHKFEDLIDSDLKRVERVCPISDIPSQAFTLPQDCLEDAPSDMCYARYLGHGLDRYSLTPAITFAHVMVFDEDTVGVLWIEQQCFTLCKRVHQTFNQHHL